MPHVACLALPCRNKHNINDNGKIVPEEVRIDDIETAIDLLYMCFTSELGTKEVSSLRDSLYQSISAEESSLRARSIREVLLKRNRPRIENQFYLANTLGKKWQLLKTRL
jgi:hypothetical protein